MPDPTIEKLCTNWRTVKHLYSSPEPGVRPSQLAAGLEQGLLEYPMFLGAVAIPYRVRAAHALHEALHAEYPSFLSSQEARLSKILERGRISSESQFMLVRHAVDVAEASKSEAGRLRKLYRLIDDFEAKGRRVA